MNQRQEQYRMLQIYLQNIQKKGLQIEEERGQAIDNVTCIKIHAPNATLDSYLDEYNVDLSCDNPNFKITKPMDICGLRIFQNKLMTIGLDDPLFQRAPKTFSRTKPVDYTNAERILLVNKILLDTSFSDKDEDTGYRMLRKRGAIKTAYPLHDSRSRWSKTGPLSDRQILTKYWGNLRCLYQQQPLNLIEKYYGSEVGFYFAWVGFYSSMLFYAAILSLLCLICAIPIYNKQKDTIQTEVCESNQQLCPVCPKFEICNAAPLKNSCKMMRISYLLDNPVVLVYSILMSFWGIIFSVLWKRRQAMLKLRWNLTDINVDNSIRPEYIKRAPIWRVSSVTGRKEYFIPKYRIVIGYLLSFFGYSLMIILFILGIFVVMYARLNILYYGKKSNNKMIKENLSILEATTSSFLTIFVMSVLGSMKKIMARWMVRCQNPRTKIGYHRSFTSKIVILSLADVFVPICYLAFFKGHLYEHPGDASQWTFFGMVKADVCPFPGCLFELAFQLFIILAMKNMSRLFREIMWPTIKVYVNKIIKTSDYPTREPVQWERDWLLLETNEEFLYREYITMSKNKVLFKYLYTNKTLPLGNVIQYGFVTFFVVALPIAPILALLNNILELRLDAHKFLTRYRRIVPKKVNGIEEWNVVVHLITVIGAISNPLLLAYRSSMIPKIIYLRSHQWSLTGFINSTLSEFHIKDYQMNQHEKNVPVHETCQYYGKRFPPDHPRKYQHTPEFWQELAVKTIFFVILENLCLLLSLLLTYVIPAIPRKVEIKRLEEQRQLRETKLQRSQSQSSLYRIKISSGLRI